MTSPQLGDAARVQAAVLREARLGRAPVELTISEQSQMLAAYLAKGDGKDKTKDFFGPRSRGRHRRYQSQTPFGELTAASWTKVADLVSQLAAYY